MRLSLSRIDADRNVGLIVVIVLTALLALTGYWKLFAHFATYDDEGYILISARNYFLHGHLYDEVYSQYGPAYYVGLDLFQRIIGPVDNSIARLLCLGLWLATAGACGLVVWRETRSVARTSFTFAATFLYLYFLSDEPFHPGSVIIFILAASVAGAAELVRRDKPIGVAILTGATAALLLLIKINVGVFYVAAVVSWGLFNATSATARQAAVIVVPLGLTAFALLLMRTLWGQPWIHVYLLVFAFGAMTLVLSYAGEPRFSWRHVAAVTGCSLVVAGVVLGAVLWRGTSPAGLLDGVLLRPLRHPGNYSYPVDWRFGTVTVAFLSLGLAAFARFGGARGSVNADRFIVILRVLVLIGLVSAFILLMHARVIGAVFSYVAPLVWVFVSPRSSETHDRPGKAIRGLLGFVLLLQFLHAYPVGGSQESWGTFLFIPLVALTAPFGQGTHQVAARTGVVAGLLAIVLGKSLWATWESADEYSRRAPLDLPGARGIRISADMQSAYEVLALNAVTHADVLFSLPGMYSLNLWTGLPTPTQKNTTLWFTLLTESEQHAIMEALQKSPRACILVQEPLVDLMRAGNVPMGGPLIDYIARSFAPVFRLEGFAFLVRAGRQVRPVNLAELRSHDETFEFNMIGDGRAVAAIEITDVTAGDRPSQVNAQVVNVTPITTMGHGTGQSESRRLPTEIKGLVRVVIEGPASAIRNPATAMIVLRDPTGAVVSKIRFADQMLRR